jgi:coiled-coil and C2 domain-containing protein 2A
MHKIAAAVPRETALVVTVQRGANLPARLTAVGGAARGRQASPVRGGAANRASASRFTTRDRPSTAAAGRSSLSGAVADSAAAASWVAGGPGWEEAEGEPIGGPEGLSCFVEVKFRGAARRTVAVDGADPIWNEQVAFPVFDLDQDASPMALKESEGVLTINVFDEIMTLAAQQRVERARGASATGAAARAGGSPRRVPGGGWGGGLDEAGDDREGALSGNAAAWEALTEGGPLPERERRFLGCLRVPLAAIYQAESIEGTFRVSLWVVAGWLVGFTIVPQCHKPVAASKHDRNAICHPQLEVPPVTLGYHQPTPRPPTLSVLLTLNPRLAAPQPPDEERVSGEQGDVAQHAHRCLHLMAGFGGRGLDDFDARQS